MKPTLSLINIKEEMEETMEMLVLMELTETMEISAAVVAELAVAVVEIQKIVRM